MEWESEQELDPEIVGDLHLPKRQAQVLGCLVTGMRRKDIAKALGISPHTVKNHVDELFKRLAGVPGWNTADSDTLAASYRLMEEKRK